MTKRIYIADNRYYDDVCQTLGKGLCVLPSVTCKALDEPVSAHPDMVLFQPEKGTLVCAEEVYQDYEKMLSPFGVKLVQGTSKLMRDYPKDVAYNVLYTPSGAFARFDCTDQQIIDLLDKKGASRISVRQGYSRCASVTFENVLITADPTLLKAGEKAGLSVLSIAAGHVTLPGYDYGFLGGASGVIEGDTVAFFGDLSFHPDGEKIRDFITQNGYFVKEVKNRPLTDIGTIFCIEL